MPKHLNTAADFEMVAIERLIPAPYNPNAGDYGAIHESIEQNGFFGALVVSRRTRHVLAGNHRLAVALKMGYESLPVTWVDVDLDGEKRILLADNRTARLGNDDPNALAELLAELAGTDKGLSGTGFDGDDLDTLLNDLAGMPQSGLLADADPDAIPDDAPTRCKAGDLWRMGVHRLIVGDSTDDAVLLRLMGGEKADCVFTSPPYAVGVDYGEYKDTIENLRAMLPRLSITWLGLVEDGGFAVVNFGDIVSAREIVKSDEPCEYPMSLEYWPVFRNDGWLLWSRRVWCKPNPRVNSLQCIQSNRAATDWEHIWTWKKPGKAIISRVDGAQRSCLGWLDTSSQTGVEVGKEIHGAGMGTGMASHMLNVHCRPSKIVVEPFCGTGTTIAAAEISGRKCYAAEISPHYADLTLARFESLTGKQAELIEHATT